MKELILYKTLFFILFFLLLYVIGAGLLTTKKGEQNIKTIVNYFNEFDKRQRTIDD